MPNRLLTDEELTETAEALFNFRNAMDIAGIKNVLWQQAKAQNSKTLKAVGEWLESLYLPYASYDDREALKEGKWPE